MVIPSYALSFAVRAYEVGGRLYGQTVDQRRLLHFSAAPSPKTLHIVPLTVLIEHLEHQHGVLYEGRSPATVGPLQRQHDVV